MLTPRGFFQVNLGVGKPSASHFSVIFCPIQDSDFEVVTLHTVAASMDHNNSNSQKLKAKKKTLPVTSANFSIHHVLVNLSD